MTVVNEAWDEEVTPPPAAPQQPAPAPQPDPAPTGDTTSRPRGQRRPLAARGTVALGGTAVVGTLLAVVGSVAGPVAMIATAAGTVMVPLAVWSRVSQSRTRRHAGQRRGRRAGGGGSWWPGGPFGGGQRRTGLGGGGGGRRGGSGGRPTSGSRSGGAGSRALGGSRGAGSRGVGTRGTGARGTGGRGLGAGGGRRGTGRTGLAGTGRRATGAGSLGLIGRGRGRGRGGSGGGRHRRRWLSGTGRGPGARLRGRHGTGGLGATTRGLLAGGGPVGQSKKARKMLKKAHRYGWQPGRRRSPLGRAASRLNGALFRWGMSSRRGLRQPTGRAAYRRAYRRYGKYGHQPTATGYLGRVFGGLAAAVPAAVMRWWVNLDRKLAAKYRLSPAATTPAAGAQAATPQTTTTAPASTAPAATTGPQQHPVPRPAFTPPAPGTAPAPTPATAGAAGATPGGTTVMTAAAFPALNAAIDFHTACAKWAPLDPNDNRKGSIWALEDALPYVRDSMMEICNGYGRFVVACERNLQGGLNPAMRDSMVQVWDSLTAASNQADELPATFAKVYAEAISRRAMAGGHTLNV